MSERAPIIASQQEPLSEASTAEEKRRAARRRFLGRSAAAGSGAVIVTLYHARAFAWWSTTKDKLISSVAACDSLKGHLVKDAWGRPELFANSVTGVKDRYKCEY